MHAAHVKRHACVWYLEATEPTQLNYSFAMVLGLHMLKYSNANRADNSNSSIQPTNTGYQYTASNEMRTALHLHFVAHNLNSSAAAFRQCEMISHKYFPNKLLNTY